MGAPGFGLGAKITRTPVDLFAAPTTRTITRTGPVAPTQRSRYLEEGDNGEIYFRTHTAK